MRHRVAHRKLGRVTEHRIAMLRNQASTLLSNERIETTVARGKELRPFVERLITVAKRSLKGGDASSIVVINARRMVARDIADRAVVTKLFDTIAPRFSERAGGYTRLLRIGRRRGDDAEVAQVELIGSEYDPKAAEAADAAAGDGTPKKRSVGERLRGALGGGKRADRVEKSRAPKPDKGAVRKVTTPRKAGGGGA